MTTAFNLKDFYATVSLTFVVDPLRIIDQKQMF